LLSNGITLAQNASNQSKKDFDFYYDQARKQVQNSVEDAEMSMMEAFGYAKTYTQKYKAYFMMGYISYQKKEHAKCIKFYKKALQFTNNLGTEVYVKNNIANNYLAINDLKQASKYVLEIIKVSKRTNYNRLYNTIGVLAKIHAKQDRLDSAKFFLNQAMAAIPKSHDKDKQVTAGFLEAKANMYKDFSQYDTAIAIYQQAINLQKAPYKKCEYLIGIAECHAKQNNITEAKKILADAAPLLGKHLHNQAQHIRISALLGYNDLDSLHKKINLLISDNEQKLSKKDMKAYTDIRDKIQDKRQIKVEKKANLRLAALLIFSFIFLVTLGLVWRVSKKLTARTQEYKAAFESQKTETPRAGKSSLQAQKTTKKREIKASEIKHRLKYEVVEKTKNVSFVNRIQKEEELLELSERLQSTSYWPRK